MEQITISYPDGTNDRIRALVAGIGGDPASVTLEQAQDWIKNDLKRHVQQHEAMVASEIASNQVAAQMW